jgi:hypothetical protein
LLVRLEQAGKISHVLLQGGDLGLQAGKLLRHPEERSRQWRDLALHGGWWNLRKRSQTALMQAGQYLEVFRAHPFFATIAGMALQGKRSIAEPAMQRFDINAEVMSSLGHGHKGHGITPFGWRV